jgi:enoyl-CoA hydratase/carnithine racemase
VTVPDTLGDRSPLRLEYDRALAVLTLARPPYNLFDEEMWQLWATAVEHLANTPPRGLLIRAEGRVVSAGVDVRIFMKMPPEAVEATWAAYLGITQALESLPCPTVFAAHSVTLTAAFELALACDLIVATPHARFGLVEKRVGFTPAMGGTQRLVQRAGPARARELVMTADLYRADTLAGWGVVNALFDSATFTSDAYAYAMQLAEGPTRAHAATKQIVRLALTEGIAAADARLPETVARVADTDDHRAAVSAFLADGPDHKTRYLGR